MEVELFLDAFRDSLRSIVERRFYETERGFQGRLLVELDRHIPVCFANEMRMPIIEQEYQKVAQEHGLTIRPDIVIHEPFDQRHHAGRSDGNFVAFELALRGNARKAAEDFGSLVSMLNVLRYQLAIFVNIDSDEPHGAEIPDESEGRIVAFAVRLVDSAVQMIEQRK